MGRRRGRRRQKKNNNYKKSRRDHQEQGWSEMPVIEGFAQTKKQRRKQKRQPRRTMEEHVVGQAHDHAEVARSKRKTVKKIRPEVPIVLQDIGATSCTHRIVKADAV